MKQLLLMFLCLIGGCARRPQQPIVEYEPTRVTLTGVVWTAVFPGPPNYEDVKQGDDAERCFFIRLLAPITVRGNPESALNAETESNLLDLAIGMDKTADGLLLENAVSNVVVVTGTLFHQQTAHHRSEVLISGETIRILANTPSDRTR